jgi:hypothetical protein
VRLTIKSYKTQTEKKWKTETSQENSFTSKLSAVKTIITTGLLGWMWNGHAQLFGVVRIETSRAIGTTTSSQQEWTKRSLVEVRNRRRLSHER